MLQSLPGGLWPLGRFFGGYKGPLGSPKSYDISIWRWRTFWSFFILNFLPAIYCWVMLNVLNNDSICYNNLLDFLLIFWSSLGVFGFYRIYYVLIILNPTLFKDIRREIIFTRGMSLNLKSHIIFVIIYLVPGFLYFMFLRPLYLS